MTIFLCGMKGVIIREVDYIYLICIKISFLTLCVDLLHVNWSDICFKSLPHSFGDVLGRTNGLEEQLKIMSGNGKLQYLLYLHFDIGRIDEDLLSSRDGMLKSVELGTSPRILKTYNRFFQ